MERVHNSEDLAMTFNDSIWPDLKEGVGTVLLIASCTIEVLKDLRKGGPKEGSNLVCSPGQVHFKTSLSSKTGSHPGWKVASTGNSSTL